MATTETRTTATNNWKDRLAIIVETMRDMRSLMAIPNYDQGVALNMTERMSEQPAAFDREDFPELVSAPTSQINS